MTWILPLVGYDSPPLTLNKQTTWKQERGLKPLLVDTVVKAAKLAQVPRMERARITLVWVPKAKGRRDTDNPIPTVKRAVDALVRHCQLLPDDDSDHCRTAVEILPPSKEAPVHEYRTRWGVTRLEARLWLRIEPF